MHDVRTLKSELGGMFTEFQALVDIKSVRINNRFSCIIDAQLFVHLFCFWRKHKGVSRVLSETLPSLCTLYVLHKILRQF